MCFTLAAMSDVTLHIIEEELDVPGSAVKWTVKLDMKSEHITVERD